MTKDERIVLTLMEECSELAQICSKVLRFGIPENDPYETRENLVQEIGDVLAMVAGVSEIYGLSKDEIEEAAARKIKKYKKWEEQSNKEKS